MKYELSLISKSASINSLISVDLIGKWALLYGTLHV